MKVFVVLAVTIAAAASVALPPSVFTSFVGGNTFAGYGGAPQRTVFRTQPQNVQQRIVAQPVVQQRFGPSPSPVAQPSQQIAILRSESDQGPDGSYRYAYETANGIAVEEQGQQNPNSAEGGTVAQGSFQYTSPEGQVISVQYLADENGFQPQGNDLPTPPPVPEAILRSLQWNAAHPEED